jgi:hypothetical protein
MSVIIASLNSIYTKVQRKLSLYLNLSNNISIQARERFQRIPEVPVPAHSCNLNAMLLHILTFEELDI